MNKLFENNRWLLGFFVLVIIIFSSLSFYTVASSANNVEQWINLTNQMFYGNHDFMFSYGPMYWIVGGASSLYSGFTYVVAKLYLSITYGLFWTMLGILVIKHRSYVWFAITYLLFFRTLNLSNSLYLLPLIFIYFLEYSQDEPIKLNTRYYFLIGLYIGLIFYIRFFFGLLGTLTISTYLFSRGVSNYKSLNLLLAFLLSVIISYLISGALIFHKLVHVVDYFIINNQLSFGNSVDMTLAVANTKLCFAMVLVSYLCLAIYCFKYQRVLFFTVSILFLMFFKMGFSRADHYFGYFVINILIVGTLLYFKNSTLAGVLRMVFIISVVIIFWYPSHNNWLVPKIFDFGIDYHTPYQQRMSNAYSMFKLPDRLVKEIGNKSVDVYPYNNEYMFANQLNYDYRPNFQNYMTLTPRLDKMNMEFFEASNKPEYVLWTGGISCNNNSSCNIFDGFDDKYSLNEDPLTSTSILLNYNLVDLTKGKDNVPVALFKRNIKTTNYSAKLLEVQDMKFRTWYKVPERYNGVAKILPNFELSLYGKAKNLLFRGGVVYVNYKFEDGSVKRYRLNIINSQSGVWVSPYITDFTFNEIKVSSVMFETTNDRYFISNFKAKWISVPIKFVHFDTDYKNLSELNLSINKKMKISGNIDSADIKQHILTISGWAYLVDNDAALSSKYLILTSAVGTKYFYPLTILKRQDISDNFNNGLNLDMAGFYNNFNISNVPVGNYRMSIFVRSINGFGKIKDFKNVLTIE